MQSPQENKEYIQVVLLMSLAWLLHYWQFFQNCIFFLCVQKIAELRTALEVVTFLPSGFRVCGVLVTDLIGDCHGQRVHPIHFKASPHLSKRFQWILYQVCVTGQAFWLMFHLSLQFTKVSNQ